jgi:flagellar basal body-associated protein FliL
MEGGVAIILLIIIVVVAGGIGIALYVTGGALWAGKGRSEGPNAGHRPEHKQATSPTTEHTEVVGAEEAAEDRSG